ncbi:MAG: nicotinate phosphoribosyltransferase, partial [Peptococcaceae bacterium]|nr:nicotinate phosphoribosyltransferase [Peptococcaceae bacterium]
MADKMNLTLLADFYELTMANGYWTHGIAEQTAYYDLFFRKVPDDGGFAIMAGLEQAIDYMKNLKFTEKDIAYLRSRNCFDEAFLEYLQNFEFVCDVWAVPEGTPIFPNEPILTVRGPAIQAQFVETMLLLTINHQSLIATKANRIVRAADGRAVLEFGSRRAQGADGAIMGARAAYIGGCAGTACTLVDRDMQIPALGTMAHSWVQMFPSEEDAFRAYAQTYPDNCTLLVDTYNVLQSGIPNAIKIFNEEVVSRGYRPKGVRIDSGDIAYLSKKVRKLLDAAGFEDCKIMASNSLDEYIIQEILKQDGKVDSFGVGERLITAKSAPVFGGVYKLTAVEHDGVLEPKIKISENV